MSLPSRERGLKFGRLGEYRYMNMSLPSRERGLKYWEAALMKARESRSLRGSVD